MNKSAIPKWVNLNSFFNFLRVNTYGMVFKLFSLYSVLKDTYRGLHLRGTKDHDEAYRAELYIYRHRVWVFWHYINSWATIGCWCTRHWPDIWIPQNCKQLTFPLRKMQSYILWFVAKSFPLLLCFFMGIYYEFGDDAEERLITAQYVLIYGCGKEEGEDESPYP